MADENTLSITRIFKAPRSVIWRCWTDPSLLKKWYCPKPWKVTKAEIDLKPGGKMNVTMQGPDGDRNEINGMLLHFIEQELLIFTDGYHEGFHPQAKSFMTGVVELSVTKDGNTKMVWSARHISPEQVKAHLEMGFEAGWNAAADQLDELAQSLS